MKKIATIRKALLAILTGLIVFFDIIIIFLNDHNYKFWLNPSTLKCVAFIAALVYVSYVIIAVIADKNKSIKEQNSDEHEIKYLRFLPLIAFVIMVLITMFTMHDEIEYFLFAHCGNEDLLGLIKLPFTIYVKLDLALLALTLLIYKFISVNFLCYALLVFLIFVWMLSGRVVGRFNYGDIVYGWFFIPTGYMKMADNGTKRDKTQVQIVHHPHYVYTIKNDSLTSSIYVGPFIWDMSDRFFKRKGCKVTDR